MNTPKSKVFKVVKDEKALHTESVNLSANGEIDKPSIEKDEITPYEKKYYALFQRCEIMKQNNERLVNRIYHVKKLLRRRKKEKKFLMERLDGYGEDYKTIAASLFNEMFEDVPPTRNPQVNSKNESSTSGILQMNLNL